MARTVFVIGPDDTVTYVEYVKEIAEQPNCAQAAKHASK